MSKIHYFQRFSQKENVVTNNTLLLFSRLYNYSPLRFKEFINQLFENEPEINVGLNIIQQTSKSKGKSIPDGFIAQESFSIIVETKLYKNYSEKQLLNHLKSFKKEKTQVLLLLSPHHPKNDFSEVISEDILRFNKMNNLCVVYRSITFEEIIKAFNEVLLSNDFEMHDVIEDYADFCDEENLLPAGKYRLRVVPCGITLDSNLEFNMYYAPADRGYRDFDYLGIYKSKKVQAIGKMQKIVNVDIAKGKFTKVMGIVSDEEKKRIRNMIVMAQKNYNHCRDEEVVSFFLVDRFYITNLKKTTSGGLFGQKYLDLRDYNEDEKVWGNTEKIAKVLRDKAWR